MLLACCFLIKGFYNASAEEIIPKNTTKTVSNKVDQNKPKTRKENMTIKLLVEAYKNKSNEYINEILNYPDSQILIANPEGKGSFFTNVDPNFVGVGAVISHEDGSRTVIDTRSSDAATVGKVKQAKAN